jgi:NAD(P)-dependent dehydrogenase (short-subunit alcohol dehydrogenase family)
VGKLDRKVAIVTGASRGIGASIAEVLAREGARVICAARTLREGEHPLEGSLESTVLRIREAGGDAEPVACNVSEEPDCERLVDSANDLYGPCDILVNNAALTYYIPVKDFPTNRWLRSTAVNFHGPFMLSKLVLPSMIERRAGAIINISSAAAIGPGRGPYPDAKVRGGTLYGAEKAALERFTQGLAEEVYEFGITVACVSPSAVVPTPGTLFHHLVSGMDDPRGEPPEYMAMAVLLLASEPQDSVTGRVTYSQVLLKEFGQLETARGTGIDRAGSGYSQI